MKTIVLKKIYRFLLLLKRTLFGNKKILPNRIKYLLDDRPRMVKKLFKQKADLPLYSGKKILLWEPAPWPVQIEFLASIGTALKLRGAEAEITLCDGTQLACIHRTINTNEPVNKWAKACKTCYERCKYTAQMFGIKTVAIGKLVPSKKIKDLQKIADNIDVKQIYSFTYKGIDVGSYVASSVIRYYQERDVDREEIIFRKYLFSALVIIEASINRIKEYQPDAVYMTHGVYTSWGPTLNIACSKNIPVIVIMGAFKQQHAYFHKITENSDIIYYGKISDKLWQKRLKTPLSLTERKHLEQYIYERYEAKSNSFTYTSYTPIQLQSKREIFNHLDIDENRPVWCVFTQLDWEVSFCCKEMAFKDHVEGILETIKMIIDNDSVQWLIKIHPGEYQLHIKEGMELKIKKMFPKLPSHIKIIPAHTNINTYSLLKSITGGITCLSTVTLELAMIGKPVIVATKSFFSDRGFTYDGYILEKYTEYLRNVAKIPPTLTPEQIENARKFAYIYFIQRQIPFKMFNTTPDGAFFQSFNWSRMDSLLPGKDPIVDMICERFFVGEDFLLDDKYLSDQLSMARTSSNR